MTALSEKKDRRDPNETYNILEMLSNSEIIQLLKREDSPYVKPENRIDFEALSTTELKRWAHIHGYHDRNLIGALIEGLVS